MKFMMIRLLLMHRADEHRPPVPLQGGHDLDEVYDDEAVVDAQSK